MGMVLSMTCGHMMFRTVLSWLMSTAKPGTQRCHAFVRVHTRASAQLQTEN